MSRGLRPEADAISSGVCPYRLATSGKCIGSVCMIWIWNEDETEGYCGLIVQPPNRPQVDPGVKK